MAMQSENVDIGLGTAVVIVENYRDISVYNVAAAVSRDGM